MRLVDQILLRAGIGLGAEQVTELEQAIVLLMASAGGARGSTPKDRTVLAAQAKGQGHR